MVAGAVFGTVFAAGTTILSCCVIGKSRTIYSNSMSGLNSTRGSAHAGCCGTQVWVNSTSYITLAGYGMSGQETRHTTGTVHHSFHGFGIFWDPGVINGHCGCFSERVFDNTTTRATANSTSITMC